MKNSLAITPRHNTSALAGLNIPTMFAAAGEQGAYRFIEFFTANIRNPHTRKAYWHAVQAFAAWCTEQKVLSPSQITSLHVAASIEGLQSSLASASVKLKLAAIRMLFDWLVIGQIMPSNPASVVRGPKHVVKKGKTPVLSATEARELFDVIDLSNAMGFRDRALIGLMVYTFARVGAVIQKRGRGCLYPRPTNVGAPA